jgi:hypothetical protein
MAQKGPYLILRYPAFYAYRIEFACIFLDFFFDGYIYSGHRGIVACYGNEAATAAIITIAIVILQERNPVMPIALDLTVVPHRDHRAVCVQPHRVEWFPSMILFVSFTVHISTKDDFLLLK